MSLPARLRLLAAAAALAAATALGEPFAVQLGAERLVFDAPPGFSDTGHLASPRINDLAAGLTSASNRILVFAITDADLRRFMGGDQLELKRYLIAVTPKGLERTRVSPQQFSSLVVDALRDLGAPAPGGDYARYLDSQPQGKASLLAELRKDPDAVSVLQGARLPPLRSGFGGWNEKPQYLLSTTTLLLLRGRAINLAVYSGFESPADVDWVKFVTRRWVEELLRLNSR